MEAPGVENGFLVAPGRVDAPTIEDLGAAANARGRSRTKTVTLLATGTGADSAEFIEEVVRAIEATAASTPWRELVMLAPGFAEDAARFALGELNRRTRARQLR